MSWFRKRRKPAQALTLDADLLRRIRASSDASASDEDNLPTEIEAAVAEICRVARTGARIAIIDKNLQAWGRREMPAWERWFSRRELVRLLKRHCREVSIQPLSYWEDAPPDSFFLAWLAVK